MGYQSRIDRIAKELNRQKPEIIHKAPLLGIDPERDAGAPHWLELISAEEMDRLRNRSDSID